ncbi:thiolase family protein [Calditerrivibrio nitroreducens]|uniref:acetyl-CoA C-acyltransferase n=1 Tax=Calditerrivibrio nitroreducens (strain DSM 19672 / NBRC 101217 / Yu37-1) TaxID=768670 RepID=E4TK13_CALNY|nr:acetyl-CoA C-acyltransferase [Calditerrivibrio nitroreducens]ADR18264.1 3-ketoacyl-CoA thiolase [Calditerrivibrio nitroreducens DSM 19672]
MKAAYILSIYRSAGCKAKRGKFKDLRPDDLLGKVLAETVKRSQVDPQLIEDVIIGCAFPEGEQGMNVSRVASFIAGLPIDVPAMTINRFCSSGLQSIAIAAERVMAGFADCIVAGGVESMTMIPMGGVKYSANPGLISKWPETYASMGITAELVAEKYGISREDQDQFALNSHMKAVKAIKEGKFADEIVPVEVEYTAVDPKGNIVKTKEVVTIDDGAREDTTYEGLAKLKPVFKLNGSVTAGNSSQMTDGAAACLVVSEDFLKRYNLKPMARFVGFSARGVEPEIMGIGPVKSIPVVLQKAGLTFNDIGLIELNEAFAAQSLAVIRNLGLNPEIINVNGGAIALGHPLGCTGTKLTATLLNEMKRRNVKYGMVSMCIGGGMGAAGIFENLM